MEISIEGPTEEIIGDRVLALAEAINARRSNPKLGKTEKHRIPETVFMCPFCEQDQSQCTCSEIKLTVQGE